MWNMNFVLCAAPNSHSLCSPFPGAVSGSPQVCFGRSEGKENISPVRVKESGLWVILQSTPASPRFICLGCAECFLLVLLATSQLKTLPVSFSFSLPSFSELTGAK